MNDLLKQEAKGGSKNLLGQLEKEVSQGTDYGYGKREDGTNKGKGFFGEIKRPDGNFSTELTIGIDFGDGDVGVPLLVPDLNASQIKYLTDGNKPTREIIGVAVNWARKRHAQGLPAYATPEEEGTFTNE